MITLTESQLCVACTNDFGFLPLACVSAGGSERSSWAMLLTPPASTRSDVMPSRYLRRSRAPLPLKPRLTLNPEV